MKVLAAVVVFIGSVSALGSGPYLPSGWRPEGPAFELPVRPPVVQPREEIILQESEGSSSDFLREYGPPKIQSLPAVATEQPFVLISAKFSEEKSEADTEVVEAATEAFIDLKYEAVEELSSATESAVTEAIQQEQVVEEKSANIEIEASHSEEQESLKNVEVNEAVVQQSEVKQEVEVKSTVSEEVKAELVEEVNVVEKEVKIVEEEVKSVENEVKIVEESVNNIAEAIVSLEKEVVAQEVQFSQELAPKSVDQSSAVVQIPEGFLEYGPPGFREYGPPNFNISPRVAEEVKSEEEKIENNETRRRRFSPKLKSTKPSRH